MITGGHAKRRRIGRGLRNPMLAPLVAILSLMLAMVPMGLGLAAERSGDLAVIVRETKPATTTAEDLVRSLGGDVEDPLDLIGGFTATIPAGAWSALVGHSSTAAVTMDGTLQMLAAKIAPLFAKNDSGTPVEIIKVLKIDNFWRNGYTGQGVDVALIDSGVAQVNGLTYPGKIVTGPDISFESQDPDLRYLDSFGHGTHMAGIIAGRDDGTALPNSANDATTAYYGVAPGARVVSVKVAGANGIVDVSQVIAAIDWVVQHRNDSGLNIRVLNLSFGTDSVQEYQLDPLAFAVEQAWHHGIVVVVVAGNDGNAMRLRDPASNPYVIAVGAVDTHGTNRSGDDTLMSFSNCGANGRYVDIVAPGKSIVGLANPKSTVGVQNPEAMLGGRFIKGTGTSQSAAIVSGLAALIIDQRPDISPDAVKALLVDRANNIRTISAECQGGGLPNMGSVNGTQTPTTSQTWTQSTGTGSLHESRGSFIVAHDGVELMGQIDIMGQAWDAEFWSTVSAQGLSWTGGDWNGATWTGLSWTGLSWSGLSWSGLSWSGLSWSGLSWSGLSWSGLSWSGLSWSGLSWSGLSWSGLSWSGLSWTGLSWSGMSWTSDVWSS